MGRGERERDDENRDDRARLGSSKDSPGRARGARERGGEGHVCARCARALGKGGGRAREATGETLVDQTWRGGLAGRESSATLQGASRDREGSCRARQVPGWRLVVACCSTAPPPRMKVRCDEADGASGRGPANGPRATGPSTLSSRRNVRPSSSRAHARHSTTTTTTTVCDA